ncbi:MAG: hypothetical protein IID38_02540 [Planctomycetes bacterium]|nr:hypothetical protein [Planctomycetota bacterium]
MASTLSRRVLKREGEVAGNLPELESTGQQVVRFELDLHTWHRAGFDYRTKRVEPGSVFL